VSGEPHTLATLPQKTVPGTQQGGGLVDSKKFFCLDRIQTHSLVTILTILSQSTRHHIAKHLSSTAVKTSNLPHLGLFLEVFKETLIFEKCGQLLVSALMPLAHTQAYYMLSPEDRDKF
jgi:hypothetical protein